MIRNAISKKPPAALADACRIPSIGINSSRHSNGAMPMVIRIGFSIFMTDWIAGQHDRVEDPGYGWRGVIRA